jgi:hypothetical protein
MTNPARSGWSGPTRALAEQSLATSRSMMTAVSTETTRNLRRRIMSAILAAICPVGAASEQPVSVRAEKDDLLEQVAQLLRRRPGWGVQAMPSPGTPPIWCFAAGRAMELRVMVVDGNSILIHLGESREPVTLGTVTELVAWLNTHCAGSLQEPKSRIIDKLKRGALFRWD